MYKINLFKKKKKERKWWKKMIKEYRGEMNRARSVI